MTEEKNIHLQQTLINRKKALKIVKKKESERVGIYLAKSSEEEVDELISKCDEALERIEADEFEICQKCKEDIEPKRLELDFTTCVCLDHYSEPQKRVLERDLELAAQMQRQILPRTLPEMESVQVEAHTEPAQIVGGDYFDFFQTAHEGQGFVIADVMGKGIAAGMLVASLQTSIRILGPNHSLPHTLAHKLNELFIYNPKTISFISMFFLTLNEKAGILHYCNAGHNPPLLWKAASEEFHWLKPTGPAIGLTQKGKFSSEEMAFSSGDLLLLYTDGYIEAQNPEGEEYGKARLANYLENNAHLTANAFLRGLDQQVKYFSTEFQDDATLLVIKAH